MATENRRYSPQEVAAVLSRAQRDEREQPGAEPAGLSRGELLETARELGFSEAQVAKALLQHEEEARILRAQKELRQLSYRRFSGHLIFFLFVNGVLGLSKAWTGFPLWLLAVCGLWMTWLLLHLRAAVLPDPDRLRLQARKRIAMQDLKESGREFQESLTAGATKLLSLSAKTIDKGMAKLNAKE